MQRHENESFDAYKARRANSNAAVKRINQRTRAGGKQTSREIQREDRDNSKHAGAYGRNLAAAAAAKRATPARLIQHEAHLAHMAARKANRAA